MTFLSKEYSSPYKDVYAIGIHSVCIRSLNYLYNIYVLVYVYKRLVLAILYTYNCL